ncbi:hypothetical protein JMM61_17725 [Rhodovulum sulfidophilum]|nr:hypothetical protein [Rhodovulum sulfidophilum]
MNIEPVRDPAARSVSSSLKPLGASDQAAFAIALEPTAIDGFIEALMSATRM